MAFLKDFEHDVFISYAHVDNEPEREGEKGWVEQFHRQLDLWLRRMSGDRTADVWRDPELQRAQLFDAVIEKAVRDSAVVISLVTKSYLSSDYCLKEIEWFHGKAETEVAGFVVEDTIRILPVLLYDIPPDGWPEQIRGTSAFRFHDDTLGVPLDPDSDEFQKQLQGLAKELVEVLERIREKTQREKPTTTEVEVSGQNGDESSFTVFLSHPSYGLEPTYRQLKEALEDGGVRVLADIPPPYDEEKHAEAVMQALEQADLSVHLLGALPGEPLNVDEPDRTFPVEQARLALEHASSQLILMPEEVDLDAIQAGHYTEFIHSVANQKREAQQLELTLSGRRQMLEHVLGKRRRLEEASKRLEQAVGGDVGTAFIDLHMKDIPQATDLVDHLQTRGIRSMMIPSADTAPTMGPFEESLKQADLFVVVYGDTSKSWVEQRLEDALKLIVTHRLPYRPAVYLAPSQDSGRDTRFAGVYEVLDDAEAIDDMIEKAEKSKA